VEVVAVPLGFGEVVDEFDHIHFCPALVEGIAGVDGDVCLATRDFLIAGGKVRVVGELFNRKRHETHLLFRYQISAITAGHV